MTNERDAGHWLFKYSPDEWLARSLRELERAEAAFQQRNAAAAHAGLKRAAGMALNAALIAAPDETWGRTYVEHVRAVGEDSGAPSAVREAAAKLLQLSVSSVNVVMLRTPSRERELIEAARTVMSYAYAIAQRGRAE
jgi:HEPN domain-containing protein